MEKILGNIIEACRRGSISAQMKLYGKYAQKLYAACLRIVGNKAEAEEAMQDSFLKIFSKIDQYKTEQNFEAWMQRIAVHTAIDYVRRQSPDFEELPYNLQEEEDDNDEADLELAVEQIKLAAQKLPPGYRTVLSLYLFEGYDMDEISAILKIQPPSVRTQYLRAKRKLLESLTAKA
ncbi:MAG: RNA polymerase sigma factor [Tannerellaceae bacterium]|jgi:RNA polymerase sigma-70 factor (ECF subfamily)|nr:RNA polymerase sigma factor [Tannerellaceae bacterium]